jgi:hypothetical protein
LDCAGQDQTLASGAEFGGNGSYRGNRAFAGPACYFGLLAASLENPKSRDCSFKRIALRCEKTAQNYGSFVALARLL